MEMIEWVQTRLAPEMGVTEENLPQFVEDTGAKILLHLEAQGLPPNEDVLDAHFEEIAEIAQMTDEEFLATIPDTEEGVSTGNPSAAGCKSEACGCKECGTKSKLQMGLLIALVLGVSWQLGRGVFYTMSAIMGIYYLASRGKKEAINA